MEHDFINNCITIFANCADWIKAVIIISIGITFISISYLIKQTIIESIKLIKITRINE
ncbi:hypothetical protein Trichorick_00166 [Candidatus Trichorickettsia mobilis]|uniref:Uncharacterized protein n=1 Tax=Candidatus Trichorickettsia mobilis TaxID=1346319 RepID=A0ABZ0UTU2_9RICK|nr:hypothetical protein [Candidatus Trichorickettsia mobilis]WPY00294.1 hypothetical protein Trichorick_00166 [Candidatus Trichorickettsia mobilis]